MVATCSHANPSTESVAAARAARIEAAAQKMYGAYREFGELHALMPSWSEASERLRDEFRAMARVALEG